MAKLDTMALEELYARKITSAVEKVIFLKEDFSKQSKNWCSNACKLKCKNPPSDPITKSDHVDILVIQDYSAFDEMSFGRVKKGEDTEKKYKSIFKSIADQILVDSNGEKLSYEITNLLKCKLTNADVIKGKAPTTTVLGKCRPYLLAEIKKRTPKVIVSLSTPVTKALGLKKANSSNCGEIVSYEGIPVVITLHHRALVMLRQNSSGAFWGPDFLSVIQKDLHKAARLVNGTLKVPDLDAAIEVAKKNIKIARSIEDVISMTAHLTKIGLAGEILSYDTETTGLDPYKADAKIILMQFGFRDTDGVIKAYVFPMWHRNNVWYNADQALPYIYPILRSSEIRKIGHNIKFDVIYTFKTTGTRVLGIAYDTMLLLHAINSGVQGLYGLKQAVWDWLPETELGGYEDKLPKLTKPMKIKEGEEEDGDGSEGCDEEGAGEE